MGVEDLGRNARLRATIALLKRAYQAGLVAEDYGALRVVFERMDVSAEALSVVLETIDGRPYDEHLIALTREAPSLADAQRVVRRLEKAGLADWFLHPG
jgi:hypothetical protein